MGNGNAKGAGGTAQQQQPGTANYGSTSAGIGSQSPGTGKGSGPKGGGGMPQNQQQMLQQLQQQMGQSPQTGQMTGPTGFNGMPPWRRPDWQNNNAPIASTASTDATTTDQPTNQAANFLDANGNPVTPAAAATGASPGGPLSGRMNDRGFGGYGRFGGWRGNAPMNRMANPGYGYGYANGGIVALAEGGKVKKPYVNESAMPDWMDKYIPSVRGLTVTGNPFATEQEIQDAIDAMGKREQPSVPPYASGGIVTLAAGGPISWTPTPTVYRPSVAALPAITQPAAFVAQPQPAIWQPPATTAAVVKTPVNRLTNAQQLANSGIYRNGATSFR